MLSRKFIAAVVVVLFSATFNQAPAQFQPGQFITYSQQDDWGLVGTPSSELLAAHID